MELAGIASATGFRVQAYPSIGSTNAEALALARAGDAGSLWVVADEQTAGRGRRGRSWHSPPGNLYATLLLVDVCAPARAPQLSLVAALALADALAAAVPPLADAIALKWPNDVLLRDAKLAGILVEGETLPDGRFAAAIGIGVNCAAHPPDAAYPATDLAREGYTLRPGELFASLSEAMRGRLVAWDAGGGFATTRRDWLVRAAHLGQPIILRGQQQREGVFAGIDGEGRLLLRAPGGTVEAFTAAEVSFRTPGQERGSAG